MLIFRQIYLNCNIPIYELEKEYNFIELMYGSAQAKAIFKHYLSKSKDKNFKIAFHSGLKLKYNLQ